MTTSTPESADDFDQVHLQPHARLSVPLLRAHAVERDLRLGRDPDRWFAAREHVFTGAKIQYESLEISDVSEHEPVHLTDVCRLVQSSLLLSADELAAVFARQPGDRPFAHQDALDRRPLELCAKDQSSVCLPEMADGLEHT
jgi:hypothetical protein